MKALYVWCYDMTVRRSKRECMALETVGDEEGLRKASATLKQRQQALRQYCADNGLSYKPDRTAVVGYNRTVAGKVNAVNRGKMLDISGGSGIIKEKECTIHPDKINRFFLQPGAKHSQEFFDVGYTENDFEKLQEDLLNGFDYRKATDKKKSDNGSEKFSIFMELGVDKKKVFPHSLAKRHTEQRSKNHYST